MLRNYLKTAWRSLFNNKAHSLLNILGLSTGMTVAILIGLWIWGELSVDKNFDNYRHVAQVYQTETLNGKVTTGKGNVIPLAAELRKSYKDDFRSVVLSSWTMSSLVSFGEKKINTQGNYMETDSPNMFSLRMVAGSGSAFKSHSTILLSASLARVLFGTADPIGRVISIGGEINEQVVGVYEDFPASSSFHDVKFIAPFTDLTSWVSGNENNWYNRSFQLFVQIADHADFRQLSAKIKDIKLSKVDAQTAKTERPSLLLHPMSRWHLYSEFENGVSVGGAIQYVWMFAITGAFVLLLACINFMNLSTARSEKRAKEVGIRKAIGSLRGQLVWQFFVESILMSLLAFLVSVALVALALPFFNLISGKETILPINNIYFWGAGFVFSLVTGLLAGLYPALYLSAFRPVSVLKGSYKAGRSAAMPRRVLVVAQFTVSIVLIIGTIVVFRQLDFAKSRPTGYAKTGLITLVMKTMSYHTNFAVIRNELLQAGAITDMAESNSPVTQNDHFNNGYTWEGLDPSISAKFNTLTVTPQYASTVGLEFIGGHDFYPNRKTDSTSVIINQAAATYMGFEDPVGRSIQQYGRTYEIIGVVKDVLMESPYDPVQPTIINVDSSVGGIINMRLNPARSTASSLSSIASVCQKYAPDELFSYQFADEEYARKFFDEERIGRLSTCFAILAIFISCLGIFGMASFMAEQRMKEIGVRKVLGASVFSLWGLLSREFVLLVTISLLIAIPTSYYFMHDWLQHFSYRTNLGWWIFGLAGGSALIVTLLTVSVQSLRAATANPVRSLRAE